jgi:hypothetical protein
MSKIDYIMDRIVREEMPTNFGAGRTVRLHVADMHCQLTLMESIANHGGFNGLSRTAMLEMEISRRSYELAQEVMVRAYGADWASADEQEDLEGWF